jgi:SAM-dependent methyltransferase
MTVRAGRVDRRRKKVDTTARFRNKAARQSPFALGRTGRTWKEPPMDEQTRGQIDEIIAKSAFRRNVYNLIPDKASRILDFGCGDGALALRLVRDKHCRGVFGLDINVNLTRRLEGLLDGVIHTDIERPDQDLPDSFEGFFNYLILHDVAEHFYDPWYCLGKLRRVLAAEGRLILATPNLQYWDFPHKILTGRFPYGPGLWHTGHLRWYTAASLVELVSLTGYFIDRIYLEIPGKVDPGIFDPARPRTSLQLPPEEIAADHSEAAPVRLEFPRDIGASYPLFFAHKLIFVCGSRADEPARGETMVYNCAKLAALRGRLDNPFDVFEPPPMELLIGDWN